MIVSANIPEISFLIHGFRHRTVKGTALGRSWFWH